MNQYVQKAVAISLALTLSLTTVPFGAFAQGIAEMQAEQVVVESESSVDDVTTTPIPTMNSTTSEPENYATSSISSSFVIPTATPLPTPVPTISPTPGLTSGNCVKDPSSFTYRLSSNDTIEVTGLSETISTGFPNIIIVPNEINGKPVTLIGTDAFDVYHNLTSVTLPNSITSIGDSSFSNCSHLTDFVIPDSVVNIGQWAFIDCDSLPNIIIPDSVTSIGEYAFADCDSFTNITVPNSITTLDVCAFAYCDNLVNITLPDSITTIGVGALGCCGKLTSVDIPNKVTSIGARAFNYCDTLASVTVPASVTSIGDDAFHNCADDLTVYYASSEEHWNQIELGDRAFPSDVTIHYNCDSNNEDDSTSSNSLCTNIGVLESVEIDGDQISIQLQGALIPQTLPITDNSDLSNQDQWNDYIGKEIVVFYSFIYGNSPYVSSEFKSLKLIDSADFGKITALIKDCIVINGQTLKQTFFTNSYENYIDTFVHYYVVDETVIYVDLLDTETCDIYDYNPNQKTITADNIEYRISDIAKYDSGYVKSIEKTIDREAEILVDKTNKIFYGMIDRSDEFEETGYKAKFVCYDYKTTMLDLESVTDVYLEEARESGLATSSSLWAAVNALPQFYDNPNEVINDILESESEIYTAILLNIFSDESNNAMAYNTFEQTMKEKNAATSVVETFFKTNFNEDWSITTDLGKLTTVAKDKLATTVKEEVFKDTLVPKAVSTGIGDILKVSSSAKDFIDKMLLIKTIATLSDEYTYVLLKMNEQCSDEAMKAAISGCVKIVGKSEEQLIAQIVADTLKMSGKCVVDAAFDKLWDVAKEIAESQIPGLGIWMMAYSVSNLTTNFLFSTDAILEQYNKLRMVSNVEHFMNKILYQIESEAKTADFDLLSAKRYLAAVELMYKAKDQSCIEAYGFVDVLDDATMKQVADFFTGDQEGHTKKLILDIRRGLEDEHSLIDCKWIDLLENDYPDSGLYEQYEYLSDEFLNLINRKTYLIECPVDVYVYDENNELIASVVNNEIVTLTAEDITVCVIDDAKTLLFDADRNYRIEYVGNDTGNMDITITEKDKNNQVVNSAEYFDIPLVANKQFVSTSENNKVVDKTTNREITPNIDNREDSTKYSLTIDTGYLIIDDHFDKQGDFVKNQIIPIQAIVPDGEEFVSWSSNVGTSIFADPTAENTTITMLAQDVEITVVTKNNAVMRGDVTGDEKITISDVMKILQHMSGRITLTEAQVTVGDINNDGNLTITDVMKILQYMSGRISSL